MSWVALAIGGSALLGYLGSQNAASAQTGAANQASQTTMAQYNQTRQDQLPWVQRGNAAGNQLAYLMGLPGYGPVNATQGATGNALTGSYGSNGVEQWQPAPRGPNFMTEDPYVQDFAPGDVIGGGYRYNALDGGQAPASGNAINPDMGAYGSLSRRFGLSDFQTEPGYLFRLSEGQKALERSASAKGMSLSGAQLKALAYYNQGFASNEYGNAYNRFNNDQTNLFNRLSGIAGTGQQANQFVGQMGANAAGQVAGNQLGAGNAAAAGWVGGTNALANGLNQWGNYNAWTDTMNQGAAQRAYNAWRAQGPVPYA